MDTLKQLATLILTAFFIYFKCDFRRLLVECDLNKILIDHEEEEKIVLFK